PGRITTQRSSQAAGISDTVESSEEDKATPQPAEPGQDSAPAQPLTEQEKAGLLKEIQLTELAFLEANYDRTYRGHSSPQR
ncbi:MAG: hypothetical protein L0312_21965, partial [Acidobacteria bacterium]|nr:hypothetical protein [Acidobacteriota bacterium]